MLICLAGCIVLICVCLQRDCPLGDACDRFIKEEERKELARQSTVQMPEIVRPTPVRAQRQTESRMQLQEDSCA